MGELAAGLPGRPTAAAVADQQCFQPDAGGCLLYCDAAAGEGSCAFPVHESARRVPRLAADSAGNGADGPDSGAGGPDSGAGGSGRGAGGPGRGAGGQGRGAGGSASSAARAAQEAVQTARRRPAVWAFEAGPSLSSFSEEDSARLRQRSVPSTMFFADALQGS